MTRPEVACALSCEAQPAAAYSRGVAVSVHGGMDFGWSPVVGGGTYRIRYDTLLVTNALSARVALETQLPSRPKRCAILIVDAERNRQYDLRDPADEVAFRSLRAT